MFRKMIIKFSGKRVCRLMIVCGAHSHPPNVGQHLVKKPHLPHVVTKEEKWDVTKIRNIGIIAHIDAGKTTTTERMLFLAGVTKSMGDVDSGDTVTDYMAQERERGITITSAAITFYWNHYRINLIDTPGHVDFTLEVERSLRVLDGAVTVLDASKGVEAQTMTVWRQAKKFNIPTIIFLNKMDKSNASLEKCLKSIEDKLKVVPLLVNTPLRDRKQFSGVADLISMENLVWSDEGEGKMFANEKINEDDPNFADVQTARDKLIGTMADLDEEFGEIVLSNKSTAYITEANINKTLRKLTLSRIGVPVFCGSSLKKKGVQPLLAGVCKYLPAPNERRHAFLPLYGQNNLCALAFKIITDKFMGRLTFMRIYAGDLTSNTKIFNVNRNCTETVQRVFIPHSDEMQPTTSVAAGNIAVVPNFTSTFTGDTLVKDEECARLASEAFAMLKNEKPEVDEVDTSAGDKLILASIQAPDPVFFCSIEPPNLASQKTFELALDQLVREDPSLKVRVDPDSLQTILEGMGELQIEIVKDRLKREFDLEVFLGPIQINYKESVTNVAEHYHEIVETLNQKQCSVAMTLRVQRYKGGGSLKSVDLKYTKNDVAMQHIPQHYIEAVTEGCINATMHGPSIGFPVQDIHVTINTLTISRGTPTSLVNACANVCLRELMAKSCTQVLEPVMRLEITVPESYVNTILEDVTKRRANIDGTSWIEEDNARVIRCTAPLAELMGFAKAVRTLSSGQGNLHMELAGYEIMNQHQLDLLKQKLSGT